MLHHHDQFSERKQSLVTLTMVGLVLTKNRFTYHINICEDL